MKKYLNLLMMFTKQNTSASLMYRTSFWSSMVADLSWACFFVVSMVFITNKIQQVAGWSRYELLILTCTCNIVLGFMAMIAKNFYRFSDTINQGKLDGILLKPVDSQFYMTFQYINISKLPRVILSFLLILYLMQSHGIPITYFNVIVFLFMLCLALICLYSVWYLLSTCIIWSPKTSNISELLFELTNVTRYPKEIFLQINIFIFLLLFPIIFISSAPSKILLGKPLDFDMLLLSITSIIAFVASRVFWKYALGSYTSVSS